MALVACSLIFVMVQWVWLPKWREARSLRAAQISAAKLRHEAEVATQPLVEELGSRRQRMLAGRKLPNDFTHVPSKYDWPDCSHAEPPPRVFDYDGVKRKRKFYVYDTATPPVFRMTVQELQQRGWERVGASDLCSADWIFSNGQRRIGWAKLGRHQLPNHLFGERQIADKSTLADHLAVAKEEGAKTPFWPETYWLRDQVDRAMLLHVLRADRAPTPPFLVKDPTLHRGRGVRFVTPGKEVSSLISRLESYSGPEGAFLDPHGHDIVQRYIPDPMLLPPHGRKFDLRVYFLIASVDPVRVYYHDGTTRSSLETFDASDLKTMGQHLTNVAVQKQDKELYEAHKEDLRQSFYALERVLRDEFPGHPSPIEDIRAQMRHALATVFLSAKEKLVRSEYSDRAFSLMGADFIIDSKLQVWLLEIQEGPVRSTNTPVTEELWMDMTSEQLDILIEIEDIVDQNGPEAVPRELSSVRKFQLIVDDNGEVKSDLTDLPIARALFGED